MAGIEKILSVLKVPYNLVSPDSVNLSEFNFGDANLVFVNCAGAALNRKGLSKIEEYVRIGGKLVTTDWAVENVVEKIFPGTIRRIGHIQTGDEVVEIQPKSDMGAKLIGLDYEGAKPKWWLESSSYPIEIINPAIVASLIESEELQKKYNSKYIAVAFPWHKGAVLHFVSHLKAQRTETRDERDAEDTKYFSEKTKTKMIGNIPADVTVSGLETNYTSLHAVTTIITGNIEYLTSDTPSGGGPVKLEILVKGYSSVSFTGQDESGAFSASYDLAKSPVTVGRGTGNMISFPEDKGVSRIHAEIFSEGKKSYVRDLGSVNSTRLNGEKIAKAELPANGIIKIGPGIIEYKLHS